MEYGTNVGAWLKKKKKKIDFNQFDIDGPAGWLKYRHQCCINVVKQHGAAPPLFCFYNDKNTDKD